MTIWTDLEFIHGNANIHPFHDKRVLITGSTGFFGSWVTMGLEKRANVTMCNRETYKDALMQQYDYIFHFAPVDIRPVIDCACRNNAKVLYSSSGAVYGRYVAPVGENDVAMPRTEYGSQKLRGEIYLRTSGLDYVIARCFTFAGPGMRDYFAITNFVKAARTGQPLVVYNQGKTIRTYLYAADLAVWLINLMAGARGTFNVGSERITTIGQLAEMVKARGIGVKVEYSDKEFIEPAPYYVPDCSKARAFGLLQWHSLDYAIERMMG